jgi:hypothetical protein
MPRLSFPYRTIAGNPLAYPFARVVVEHPKAGRRLAVWGLVDSGADLCTLNVQLAGVLGIRDLGPPTTRVAGVHGVADPNAWRTEFLRIGFDPGRPRSKPAFPNGDRPVPVLLVPDNPWPILGRDRFLDLCRACLDGPRKTVFIGF